MEINIETRRIITCCAAIIAALFAAHAIGQAARFLIGTDYLLGLVPLFSFYEEANIPTWTSGLLLFACCIITYITAAAAEAQNDPHYRHWHGLSLIFLFLSADEVVDLHGVVGRAIDQFTGWSESFIIKSLWIIPFSVLALAILVLYARFLLALPRRTAALFLLSGSLFVVAAVGFEILEGRYLKAGGSFDAFFMLLVTIEEVLEMGAVTLFLVTCFEHLQTRTRSIRVNLVR